MDQYIGLDVSLKETHICVVDASGALVARGREITQPEMNVLLTEVGIVVADDNSGSYVCDDVEYQS
jgi:hypothetical protein